MNKRMDSGEGGMRNAEGAVFPFRIPLAPLLSLTLILGLLAGLIGYALRTTTMAAPPPWSANTPIFGDLGPSLQSEPVVALNGSTSLVAWTDERNTLPDIYAKVSGNAQFPDASDARVTGPAAGADWLDSAIDPRADTSASAQVEANGRAFIAYSTHSDIVLARREPNGTWLSRTLMSSGGNTWFADARQPALVVVGDTVVAVWQDFRNQNWDIYSARCNGISMICQPNIKVSDDTVDEWQIRPALAADGNTVLAVWEDLRESGATTPHIYASFSADGGATWGANARVDAGSTPATRPRVAFEPGGQPWVVWESHADEATSPADIVAARWSGSAWGTPVRVDAAPANVRALNPVIVVAGTQPFVAWEDYRNGVANPDIYAARWTGSAWVEGAVMNQPAPQTAPALAASGSSVRIAWQDGRQGQADVFAANWNGSAWVDAAQLNENAARLSLQTFPTVQATVWGDLYLTWRDTRENENNFWVSRRSRDTGQWSTPVAVPTRGEGRYGLTWNEPAATAVDSDGHLHVVWSQYGADGTHIWHSEFDGTLWGPVMRLSPDGPDQGRGEVAIAIHNGRMAAAWTLNDTSAGWPGRSTMYVAEFNAGTGIWSAPTTVNTAPMRGDPHPSLALDDAGTIYVAYADFTFDTGLKGNIKVAKKPFGSGAWSLFQQVNSADTTSTDNWCYHEQPQIAAVGTVLHVVWLGCVPWTRGVYYSTSTNGGASWSGTSLKLASLEDGGLRPSLAANPEELSVVYPDSADGSFHAAALRGNTWYTGTVLSDGATALQYNQDGPVGLTYNPGRSEFVAVFADRRTRDVPRLYTASLDSDFAPPPPPPTPTLPPGVTPNGPTATPPPTPDLSRLPRKIYLPVTVR